jgi:hypothetical protein
MRIPEVVHELVDQDAVLQLERMLHRRGWNVESLQDESPHEHCDQNRHAQQKGQLAPEIAARL